MKRPVKSYELAEMILAMIRLNPIDKTAKDDVASLIQDWVHDGYMLDLEDNE